MVRDPVPPSVVTSTFTTPEARAGAVAVIDVVDTTVTPVAAVPPKETVDAAVKPVPVIVTAWVEPAATEVGVTADTVGAATTR